MRDATALFLIVGGPRLTGYHNATAIFADSKASTGGGYRGDRT